MIGSLNHLTLWAILWVQCVTMCSKLIHWNFFANLHYQAVIDQRLTVFHQLFSWTSVGLSECPIDKVVGSQSYLIDWTIPWVPSVLAENSFTSIFCIWINFEIRHCKKLHWRLRKISRHYRTVIDQRLKVFLQLFI